MSARLTETLVERARTLVVPGERRLLGITGAPAAGKSTLAGSLTAALAPDAVLVPMDGFHLAATQLRRLGRLDRKGAPDTFDAAGYLALLRRLCDRTEDVVYAPEFRREIEEPIAGAIAIEPSVRLIVIEGNYLLAPTPPWDELRDLFDEVWYCERDERKRVAYLIQRHHEYGKSPEEARHWALGSDQRNAEFIATTRSRADIIAWLDGRQEIETDGREIDGASVSADRARD
jgi:pantothenate kinase